MSNSSSDLLRKQLQENLDEARWEWLLPHLERGVVIVAAASLDLIEVGMAIAQDQVKHIESLLAAELLYKASIEDQWPSGQCFGALIVEPYILIQAKTL